MFNTSTPKLGHFETVVGRMFNRRNRKMWSRAIWGLKLPGRYFFLTLTSTPKSPDLKDTWHALQRWFKRYRPGITWLYCFTIEGKARVREWDPDNSRATVIHMIIRLGMKQKRLDVKEVRKEWTKLTGARQIKIRYVPESKKEKLAGYISNQKLKRGLAKEMGYQSAVTRWRWSSGWLPKGFTKQFGRAWVDTSKNGVPYGLKLKVLSDWLHRYKFKDGLTWRPGELVYDGPEIGWILKE